MESVHFSKNSLISWRVGNHFEQKFSIKKLFRMKFLTFPYFQNFYMTKIEKNRFSQFWARNILIFWKCSLWHLSQISKYSLPKSPRGPPNVRSEKYGISAITGKKIIKKSFLDQFLSKSEKGPSKHTENNDTHAPTPRSSWAVLNVGWGSIR